MATLRIHNGNGVWVETNGTLKEAFKEMAQFMECFAEKSCGVCDGEDIRPEHRQDAEAHDYYSMRCNSCGAQLDFGQHKKGGGLFAKRKLEDGTYDKERRGWYHYSQRKPRGSQQGNQPAEDYGEPAYNDDPF